jgi:hypothetical protein
VKQIAGFVRLNSNPDNIIRFTKSSSSMMNNQDISFSQSIRDDLSVWWISPALNWPCDELTLRWIDPQKIDLYWTNSRWINPRWIVPRFIDLLRITLLSIKKHILSSLLYFLGSPYYRKWKVKTKDLNKRRTWWFSNFHNIYFGLHDRSRNYLCSSKLENNTSKNVELA